MSGWSKWWPSCAKSLGRAPGALSRWCFLNPGPPWLRGCVGGGPPPKFETNFDKKIQSRANFAGEPSPGTFGGPIVPRCGLCSSPRLGPRPGRRLSNDGQAVSRVLTGRKTTPRAKPKTRKVTARRQTKNNKKCSFRTPPRDSLWVVLEKIQGPQPWSTGLMMFGGCACYLHEFGTPPAPGESGQHLSIFPRPSRCVFVHPYKGFAPFDAKYVVFTQDFDAMNQHMQYLHDFGPPGSGGKRTTSIFPRTSRPLLLPEAWPKARPKAFE